MDQSKLMYFYRPLGNGGVFKCAGICTADNREWFLEAYPGTMVVEGYKGDRISADGGSFTLLASKPDSQTESHDGYFGKYGI